MEQDLNKEYPDGSMLIWEPAPLIKPEFRLYYDDTGHVICYTCEKLEGNYVVVDASTYAEGRPDVRVIEGKISTVQAGGFVSKLMREETILQISEHNNINPSQISADTSVECAEADISIIVNKKYKGTKTKWKMTTYELR